MANRHTVQRVGGTKQERIANAVARRAEAEKEADKYAAERAAAEKLHRAAKKVIAQCTAEIAAIAME